MRLRTRLLILSVSTVAVIVAALFAVYLDTLTRYWIDSAVERSSTTGQQIQSALVMRIADSPAAANVSLADTKRNWSRIVASDKDVASMLVEQTAVPSGVIVEVNIIGEDGHVLVSSNPSRQGKAALPSPGLNSVRDSGPIGRLMAIMTSRTDYETRVRLGIPEQPNIFDIQLLVSPVLLRDKILPDLRQNALVSLLALLAAAALAAVSAQRALRPVRRIGKVVDTLATGNPLGLTLPRESDEQDDQEVAAIESKLSLLGEQMQGARRDADQLRSAIGSLARGVAHEIKNPLNAIALRLETLRMRLSEEAPDAEPEIDLLSNEVRRLDRVVRTFLDLNRPMELDLREFSPVELASGVIELMRPAAEQVRVELQLIKPGEAFSVEADRGLIEQAVLNVVNNAIQAIANDENRNGPHFVRTSVTLSGDICEIAVTDNGPGMPANVRDRIFEPYYTTKATGSGIGLAFTKRAMDLHRGRVIVESAPGRGATLVLAFPVIQLPAAGSAIRSAGA